MLRCDRFLKTKNPLAAKRAAQAIKQQLNLLTTSPNMGRHVLATLGLRELTIGFGDSGYVALYRYKEAADTVVVVAFRHQKEAGY